MTLQSNTLQFRKDLIQNGMSEELAETVIHGLRSVTTDHLATKADLVELKAELKGDLADLKGDIGRIEATLKGDIGRVETELKWIKVIGGSIFTLLVAIAIAVVKLAFFP